MDTQKYFAEKGNVRLIVHGLTDRHDNVIAQRINPDNTLGNVRECYIFHERSWHGKRYFVKNKVKFFAEDLIPISDKQAAEYCGLAMA